MKDVGNWEDKQKIYNVIREFYINEIDHKHCMEHREITEVDLERNRAVGGKYNIWKWI